MATPLLKIVNETYNAQAHMPTLDVQNLSAGYGKRQVLRNVSLNVHPGEVVAVLGHNGAGKSTLLRSILGTIPKSGNVTFQGRDISRVPYYKNVEGGISHSLAEAPVFGALDVETNLKLGGYTENARELPALMEEVYTTFPKLRERQKQASGTLSGGERRMLAVGMAMMSRPSLMLLDEPSIGLAPQTAHQILAVINKLCKERQMAAIIVDQSVRSTLRVADRVYYLRMGEILLTEDSEAARKREHFWDLF
ncbi:ATP-binding cassette domain-containing protein [Rhizobium lusitanum]|uniref:ATP-binding cassette domain-containing protein n=1 Tax=Rhizobium lusitanum TaxID=293958 RepID=A0A6L9UE85_9HYPH|nr:ABC transporter ATP-binding protein [Rhizobium lusitanum]NEI73671.1 ATP-binding cassette domain-containing protein [Rhizobium lusitanum]